MIFQQQLRQQSGATISSMMRLRRSLPSIKLHPMGPVGVSRYLVYHPEPQIFFDNCKTKINNRFSKFPNTFGFVTFIDPTSYSSPLVQNRLIHCEAVQTAKRILMLPIGFHTDPIRSGTRQVLSDCPKSNLPKREKKAGSTFPELLSDKFVLRKPEIS